MNLLKHLSLPLYLYGEHVSQDTANIYNIYNTVTWGMLGTNGTQREQ